jgi:hypothetical protein
VQKLVFQAIGDFHYGFVKIVLFKDFSQMIMLQLCISLCVQLKVSHKLVELGVILFAQHTVQIVWGDQTDILWLSLLYSIMLVAGMALQCMQALCAVVSTGCIFNLCCWCESQSKSSDTKLMLMVVESGGRDENAWKIILGFSFPPFWCIGRLPLV